MTECDSRPITARSRCSSRGDGPASREGSRDSRAHSDGQPLSARSQDIRQRQPLSAPGPCGSDAGGSDISGEGAPLSARTSSGELCPRGLPQFSPRFLSPRVGPPGGLGGGVGGFGSARPSPRLHSVTAAGPRSLLSPRCGPGSLIHPPSELVPGCGPFGVGGPQLSTPLPATSFQSMTSPRQRQVIVCVYIIYTSWHICMY